MSVEFAKSANRREHRLARMAQRNGFEIARFTNGTGYELWDVNGWLVAGSSTLEGIKRWLTSPGCQESRLEWWRYRQTQPTRTDTPDVPASDVEIIE